MTKSIMVQGTMSGAGKSLLVAALCRIFKQDGHRVAPFKSQNMALNSYITQDGLEMGRAQVVQAYASGLEPDVRMNPILLKPASDVGSQLIVNGEVRGNYQASEYFAMKSTLVPDIMEAYDSLAADNDIIVIEGAGSPAEINLKDNDIVNMGMAKMANAPVLLVGDIDRGGVFAQLFGTVELLEPEERERIVGMVINKFRGDPALLDPGLEMLEDKTGIRVAGVVPYTYADVDDEDSLAPRLLHTSAADKALDIAVIRLPRLSNFTDFAPLEHHELVSVRYVSSADELGMPDAVIVPGTKNTMDDLLWMRETGLAVAIPRLASNGVLVLGVCGGYQMLGRKVVDPIGVEHKGSLDGLGLLPCVTTLTSEKTRTRMRATVSAEPFAGVQLDGYEIHMGKTEFEEACPFCELEDGRAEGAAKGSVFGTYLHGLFDSGELVDALVRHLLGKKGVDAQVAKAKTHREYQDEQINILAAAVREALDMGLIYSAMDEYERG